MRTSIYIKVVTLLIITTVIGCKDQKKGMSQSTPKYYATENEAIEKAKSDLLSIIRTSKGLSLGVDEKALQEAKPGIAVKQSNIDFEKLLTADSTSSFEGIKKGEMATIFPLVAGDRVVTVVELNKDEKGWSIAGLAGKSIANDLNTIKIAVGPEAEISVYDIPNLQVKVYGVKKDGAEIFYTDYGGQFSLRQGVNASQLMPVLAKAAQEFQRLYGDELKKQRLVK
jgi:hypothetical protein